MNDQSFTDTKEALHYLSAIKVRLELLYEHSTQDARLLEHLSDEVDWVDAEIGRLRSGGVAQTPAAARIEALEAALREIADKSYPEPATTVAWAQAVAAAALAPEQCEAHMNTHPYVVTILSTGVRRSFRTKWEATDRIYRLRILWGLEAKLDLNSEAK